MKIPTSIFKIPTLRTIANKLFLVSRRNSTSTISPILMSYNTYESPKIAYSVLRTIGKEPVKFWQAKPNEGCYGESPHDPGQTLEYMGEDILYLIRLEQLRRITLLGHCMGGRAVMYFSLKYREYVEKAIIVDMSPISMPRNMEAMTARPIVARQLEGYVCERRTVYHLIMNLKKLPSGEFAWCDNVKVLHASLTNFRSCTDYFPNLVPFTGPMLFIGGHNSNFLPPSEWPQVKEIFPNALVIWLDAGHLVHFDQPKQFVELVTEFLKSS